MKDIIVNTRYLEVKIMLELKEALQQRLAVLNGLPTKSENKVITNTTREYIAYTLTQAGILNEQGEIRNFKISA
jgi:hypothetical protein